MPTGTRSSISANKATKPMIATASVLKCKCASSDYASFDRFDLVLAAQEVRVENEAIGAHRDQQHRGYVAEPGRQEKRPNREPQIERQHVVGPGAAHLVEQRVGLHRHDE